MKPAYATILGSLIALGMSLDLWALPQDPVPIHGQVQIQNGANFVQILQQSPRAILNWNSFNIGLGESVRFLQPGQQAAILNRVTGLDPSLIQGTLQANGRVFLVNPNGILFGPQSVVDVGSFTASTLTLSDADFLADRMTLTQDPTRPLAALVNRGEIRVGEGGFVVLVAPAIHQDGLIVANSGQIQLGATRQATLSLDGQGLVSFVVPDGFSPAFQNPQSQRDTVLMSAGQVNDLFRQVVSHPGVLEAASFQGEQLTGGEGLLVHSGQSLAEGRRGGNIRLDSSQTTVLTPGSLLSANGVEHGGSVQLLSRGTTVSGGNISASASQGQGGFAEVSGLHFALGGGLDVSGSNGQHGEFLLDPGNLTIVQGAGPGSLDGSLPTIVNATGGLNESVSTNQISAITGTVTLQATNNVTYPNATGINAPNTRLVVSAGNDIAIDAPGSLSLVLDGLDLTAGGRVSMNSTVHTSITTSQGIDVRGRDVALNGQNMLLNGGTGLRLEAGAGNLTVDSTNLSAAAGLAQLRSTGGDTRLTTNGLTLAGSNVEVSAANDLQVGVSGTISLAAANTTFSAGRDLTQSSGFAFGQGSPSQVSMSAGRDIRLQNSSVGLERLSVNATRDLTLVSGASQGYNTNQSLDLVAGQRMSVNSTGGTTLNSSLGTLRLQGQSVDLRGTNYNLTGPTGVTVLATAGNLSFTGDVLTVSGSPIQWLSPTADVTIQGTGLSLFSSNLEVSAANDLQLGVSGTLNLGAANTTFSAGRDLTQSSGFAFSQSSPSQVSLSAGRDIRLQNSSVGLERLSVNATRDLTLVNSASQGYNLNQGLSLVAGQRTSVNSTGATTLSAGAGSLLVQGQSVDLRGTNYSLSGAGVTALASAGNLTFTGDVLTVTGSPVRWLSPTADVTIQGTGLSLSSSNLEVSAGNDLQIGIAGTTSLSAANTTFSAGRDLNQTGNVLSQSSASNVSMLVGRDARLQNNSVGVNRLSVNATRDLILDSPQSQSYTGTEALELTAGRNLSSNSTLDTSMSTDRLSLSGSNISLAGRTLSLNSSSNASLLASQDLNLANVTGLTLTAPGAVIQGSLTSSNALFDTGNQGLFLSSNGNLDATGAHLRSTGQVSANATNQLSINRVTAPEVRLSGANISLASVGNLSGGNYTLSTPGNLTERIPVTNATAPTLGGLNVSAGRIFGSGTNTSFSVPGTSSGVAQVAVTAGNDSVLNASASMFQFNGVNVSLQTVPQTGDIYVDGVLQFQGSPPSPPPPPPPPPPLPSIPSPASRDPVSSPPAANQALTPDQRAELLAQSNLTLGNLGSFSRVLSEQEREALSVRHDSLHQTWALDPFSPTLALTVPGGAPPVYPSELAQLTALLMMSGASEDAEEKTRQSYNVIVDQELREIWEVRYWRHLLENLIIWEDRE